MKAILFLGLIICNLFLVGVTYLFAQAYSPKYVREKDQSLLRLTSNATEDGWLEFKIDGEVVEAATFTTKFARSLGLQDDYSLHLVRDKTDLKQMRHQHYQLYYKNVLVEGGT